MKIQTSHENISILSLPYLPYLFHFIRLLQLSTGEYINFSFIWAKLVCVCSFKNVFLILSSKQCYIYIICKFFTIIFRMKMLISVGPTISEDQGNEPKNMNHGWMKRWNYIVSARKQMITQGSSFKDFFHHPSWKRFSSPTEMFYQDITIFSKLCAKKTSEYSSLLNCSASYCILAISPK